MNKYIIHTLHGPPSGCQHPMVLNLAWGARPLVNTFPPLYLFYKGHLNNFLRRIDHCLMNFSAFWGHLEVKKKVKSYLDQLF